MATQLRSAGIFLHPTSLPSRFGAGDMGESAFCFIDRLVSAKQKYWQICPLGPTGYGDSPYQCLSSCAGNYILISPQGMVEKGLLDAGDLDSYPRLREDQTDFASVRKEKSRLLRKAFNCFKPDAGFKRFCGEHHLWLDDYALFMACKDAAGGLPWYEWEKQLRTRNAGRIANARAELSAEIDFHCFVQYVFFSQWEALRTYANKKGRLIIGDVPYYVAYDSSDTWTNPEEFELDKEGQRLQMGGVPPDYFSQTGQLWGNPVYKWKKMEAAGYEWWVKRFEAVLKLVDIVRIDHFRAFESYWSIPAGSETAVKGKWVNGPGAGFFKVLETRLGKLPLIAEDLGIITDKVRKLISDTGLPGMKVLQFAFDWNPENPYLPYNIPENSVVYTGTHDNNTSVGWYCRLSEDQRDYVRSFIGCSDEAFHDYFLRMAYSSPARTCIIPLQDVIGLDEKHRFNTPGTGEGNWGWRFTWDMLKDWMLERTARYTKLYGRAPA
jgi:4-alpha-glucanotransferase